MQTQGMRNGVMPYRGTLSALRWIAHEEGIRGLYRYLAIGIGAFFVGEYHLTSFWFSNIPAVLCRLWLELVMLPSNFRHMRRSSYTWPIEVMIVSVCVPVYFSSWVVMNVSPIPIHSLGALPKKRKWFWAEGAYLVPGKVKVQKCILVDMLLWLQRTLRWINLLHVMLLLPHQFLKSLLPHWHIHMRYSKMHFPKIYIFFLVSDGLFFSFVNSI